MRTKLYFVIILLAFFALAALPSSFAQDTLAHPSVRLVYFLPSDRPARPDRIEAFRQLIKDAQEFYADEMERHGYGRKTFRVETDRTGEPIVHRFNGRFNERHYYETLNGWTDFKVWSEFFQKVNDLQHVYLIAIDLSYELLGEGDSCGLGGVTFSPANVTPVYLFGSTAVRHRDITPGEEVLGGSAIIPASGHCFFDDVHDWNHPLRVTTHELAHAFGLEHDFSDPDSAVGGNGFRFSECDTEWLSVSRFFNNPVSNNSPGDIQLVSTPTYSTEGINIGFEVTDADGLHQAQLLVPEIYEGTSWGAYRLFGCKQLNGETSTIEFISEELIAEPVDRITLQIIDVNGNITWATFPVDIASIVPLPKVVSIPDPNLAAAIRTQLDLAPQAPITDRAMQTLRWLNLDDQGITDIAGLEHATQLQGLLLGKNQIDNYAPLAQLPKLTTLYLWTNNISDLTVLPILPQLALLDLNWNQISDISRLAGFTKLTTLMIKGNKISDIKPLSELAHLRTLSLSFNDISNVRPLAELTNLRRLYLAGNPIADFSPLRTLLANNPNLKIDIDIPFGFSTDFIADQPFIIGTDVSFTLPIAAGGTAPYTYTLSPIPAGLQFDRTTRILSGKPTTASTTNMTYTATDATGQTASLTFTITVTGTLAFNPSVIADQTFTVGEAVNLTLPVATGGTAPYTYTLSPIPAGLQFNPTTQLLSGTPTTAAAATSITYTARDAAGRSDSLTFRITVRGKPTFNPGAIADQTFTVGTPVNLTLPVATGGTAPYAYTLAPLPAGLSFNATQRELSGEPTTAETTATTYTATDAANVSASLTFTIEVIAGVILDVNGDGQVNVIDLAIVALFYGTQVPASMSLPADVNTDGVVDILDLTAVAQGIDAADGVNGLSLIEVEAGLLAAVEQGAELEAIAGAPASFGSARWDVLSGSMAAKNIAAALSDVRQMAVGDVRLGKGMAVLEELLQLLSEMVAIPELTALLPNYPNPFNPETWIPYQLAKPADVSLTIYAVNGQVVRRLALGHQAAGVYQSRSRAVYWDGRNAVGEPVASGAYFYTLTAGDFTVTRKMLIKK